MSFYFFICYPRILKPGMELSWSDSSTRVPLWSPLIPPYPTRQMQPRFFYDTDCQCMSFRETGSIRYRIHPLWFHIVCPGVILHNGTKWIQSIFLFFIFVFLLLICFYYIFCFIKIKHYYTTADTLTHTHRHSQHAPFPVVLFTAIIFKFHQIAHVLERER